MPARRSPTAQVPVGLVVQVERPGNGLPIPGTRGAILVALRKRKPGLSYIQAALGGVVSQSLKTRIYYKASLVETRAQVSRVLRGGNDLSALP